MKFFCDIQICRQFGIINATAYLLEITGEIEPINVGREKLSQLIVERADKELLAFGIKLIDVQLRRISY